MMEDFKRSVAVMDDAKLKEQLQECERSIKAVADIPMMADMKNELAAKREII